MWIRRAEPLHARMPSSARAPGLNPRQRTPAAPAAKKLPPTETSAPPEPPRDEESDHERAARVGGFHESSYELQHGLQVSESEWPDDVTVPGALGDR